MHSEIMQFPSAHFYENKLKILPEGFNDFQLKNIEFSLENDLTNAHDFYLKIQQKRVLFLNTEPDNSGKLNKTNAHEARVIGELVNVFNKISNNYNRMSIGVITPYRAQIAQIQSVLRDKNFDIDSITIDTVERYQGGARDVILISLCTNDASQLASLVSLSEEGVDRKLNVALTRARQHLVIVGNAEILRGSPIYSQLIEMYG
jgi:DNA replication ATP-dependent helicase Dna2